MQAPLVNNASEVYQPYRDFFFENFNFAVIENNLKWHEMEPIQVLFVAHGKLIKNNGDVYFPLKSMYT